MKSSIRTAALFTLLALSACERQQESAQIPLANGQAIERAKAAAQESFSRLSAELKAAIETGGTASAIAVCSERAPGVLSEVAAETGFTITRISDKPRNPDHAAVGSDLAAIDYFRKGLTGDGPNDPQVASHPDGSKTVRLPIVIGLPLCLQCHGSDAEIAPQTRAAIVAAYPDDQATGYQLGDLRGIWRIDVPVPK